MALVQHAAQHVVPAHDQCPFVGVLVVHVAFHLARAAHVQRGVAVEQVVQNRRDNLLARPERNRLPNGRGHGLDGVVGELEVGRQVRETEENQLLVLFAAEKAVELAQLHAADDMVLDQPAHRAPIGRNNVLLVGVNEFRGLGAAQLVLGEMDVDLVAVEVGVVALAVGVVHADHALPAVHLDAVRHQTHLVQRRLPVHQHPVPVLQVPSNLARDSACADAFKLLGQRRPHRERLLAQVDLEPPLVDHVVGPGPRRWAVDDGLSQFPGVILVHRLGPGELPGKDFRDSDLVGIHKGVWRDDRAARKVDALAHHVHSHQTLLPLQLLPYTLPLCILLLSLARVDHLVDMGLHGHPLLHQHVAVHLVAVLVRLAAPLLVQQLQNLLVLLHHPLQVHVVRVLELRVAQVDGRAKAVRGHEEGLEEEK
mmetsp:Transcript_36668/g.86752  ORF Transcript_36668/g.86752 Transcript_36668/m.86752 type:complete len:424 (-) Transcript_36668:226-1497(-)